MPAISEISEAARAIGGAIQKMRVSRRMSLEDLSRGISEVSNGVHIGVKTLELVEKGSTDAQFDHMLALLATVGLDMRLPDSAEVARERIVETRLGEVREALRKARHPEGMRKISFKALSDACGIEQGQIGRIESGETMPRFRTVLALTRALGIDVRFARFDGAAARAASARNLRRGRSAAQRRKAA